MGPIFTGGGCVGEGAGILAVGGADVGGQRAGAGAGGGAGGGGGGGGAEEGVGELRLAECLHVVVGGQLGGKLAQAPVG